jgi:hypothetical protein
MQDRTDEEVQSQEVQRRRRVLRGLVGAPVIYTLPLGSALAASSLGCLDKSQALAAADNPDGITSAPDDWVRAPLVVKENGSNIYVSVSGSDPWFKYEPVSGAVTQINNLPGGAADSQKKYYGLVDYQGNNIYGVFPQESAVMSPIAGASCWNSLGIEPSADAQNLI